MRRTPFSLALLPAVLLVSGCGANTPNPNPTPDRVLAVDETGKIMRQTTADEHSTVVFPASKAKVWKALVASYAELGVDPTIADPATGTYGNTAFLVPKRVMGRAIGQFFDCGSGMTGALVDAGRVTATVVTTLTALSDSTTSASTHVTGSLRRNDGVASNALVCSSTGSIEEHIRTATLKRLESVP
jgi:hypothetical protein